MLPGPPRQSITASAGRRPALIGTGMQARQARARWHRLRGPTSSWFSLPFLRSGPACMAAPGSRLLHCNCRASVPPQRRRATRMRNEMRGEAAFLARGCARLRSRGHVRPGCRAIAVFATARDARGRARAGGAPRVFARFGCTGMQQRAAVRRPSTPRRCSAGTIVKPAPLRRLAGRGTRRDDVEKNAERACGTWHDGVPSPAKAAASGQTCVGTWDGCRASAAMCGACARHRARAGHRHGCGRQAAAYLPAIVICSISTEPDSLVPRTIASAPTATMLRNMSCSVLATVIPSTGYWIAPFSTQNPAAPCE